jgi:hypothetical protein
MRLDPRREILVTAQSTATQRFVQRCGELFGLTVICIEVEREGTACWKRWGRRVLTSAATSGRAGCRVILSPPCAGASAANRLSELPLPDRATAASCDRLLALHVRPGGNLQRMLKARLEAGSRSSPEVFVAIGSDLVSRRLADELMDLGAVGWLVMNSTVGADHESPSWPGSDVPGKPLAPIIDCPSAEDWPYLTHCTRRRQGPWPDEAEADYLDDLILDRIGADHSALAALWRIVGSGRLIAGCDIVRGDTPVVSFTAVPVTELPRLRTFRSHLSRWDFEPYGICIRRDWLQHRGARPVRYGDESTWAESTPQERVFFQKSHSRSAGGTVTDWTVEQEWRHVGDVPLDDLPRNAALLFVPSATEAKQLSTISPWPVTLAPAGC